MSYTLGQHIAAGRATLAQFVAAGCIAVTIDGKADLIGSGIFYATRGQPCKGCLVFSRGCSALRAIVNDVVAEKAAEPTETVRPETVRQEAARRNISIGEVRRQRSAVV